MLYGDKLQSIKGVELLTDLYETSGTAISSYESLIRSSEYSEVFSSRRNCLVTPFEGDFLTESSVAEWTNADIVFANSTCFNFELMTQIAALAVRMRRGSRFICFTTQLPSNEFQLLEKINLGMSWGTATCYIHIR